MYVQLLILQLLADQVFISALELVNIAANSVIQTSDQALQYGAFTQLQSSSWNTSFQLCNSLPFFSYSLQIQSNGTYTLRNSQITAPQGLYQCGTSYTIQNTSFTVKTASGIGANFNLSLTDDISITAQSNIIAGLFQLSTPASIQINDTNITQVLTYNQVAAGPLKFNSGSSDLIFSNCYITGDASVYFQGGNITGSSLKVYTDPIKGGFSEVSIKALGSVTLTDNSYVDAESIFIQGPTSISLSSADLDSDLASSPIQNSITLDSNGPINVQACDLQAEQGILIVGSSFNLWGANLNATAFDGQHYDINLAATSRGVIQSSLILGDDINILASSLSIQGTPITSFKPQTLRSEAPEDEDFSYVKLNLEESSVPTHPSVASSIFSHLSHLKSLLKSKRQLSSLSKQDLSTFKLKDSVLNYTIQAEILAQIVPNNCIHIGSTGSIDLYNSPIVAPTGIGIFGDGVTMQLTPVTANLTDSNIVVIAQGDLNLQMNDLSGSRLLLQGANSVNIGSGSDFYSTIPNTCSLDTSGYSELFYCVSKGASYSSLTPAQVLQNFNGQFNTEYEFDYEMFPTMVLNFTLYIFSYGQVTISSGQQQAPKIGICGSNVSLSGVYLNTTGRGCPSDAGLGMGILASNCSGSGASHGGMGGFGASDTNSLDNIMSCADAVSGPYSSQGDECRYEGSGGASGVSGNTFGGNGGGIVWVSTPSKFNLSYSQILADGLNGVNPPNQNALHGSGGGSGGSIQIITETLAGNGYISASGGQGSSGGGGGGAGGKFMVNYLRNFIDEEQSAHTYDWTGSIYISGGLGGDTSSTQQSAAQSGQAGTIWHPKCLPGYSGALCDFCPIGTFKYGYSYGECLPCQSAPDNSYYTEKAWTNADCPYACSADLEPVEINPDCLNSFDLSLQRLGAEYEFLVFASVFIILTLLMWICLIQQSTNKTKHVNKRRIKMYMDIELEQQDRANAGNLISGDRENIESTLINQRRSESETRRKDRLLRKSMVKVDIEMKDQNLFYHYYRMYFTGDNSITFPWTIPEDFPAEKLFKEEEQKKMDQLIDQKQEEFQWSGRQKMCYYLLRVFYPPLANSYHRQCREAHYASFKKLMQQTFEETFWSDNVGNMSMRILCSKNDYTVGHIDFLDYYKSFETYKGPKVPLTILLTGAGTFNCPYHFNYETDPIAKQIVLFNKPYLKEKLPLYLDNLNSFLYKLSFLNYTGQILKDLDSVVEWIDYGNEHLFNPIGIRMTLFLFENTYKTDDSSMQKRRSFPIDSTLLASFPQAFKKLIRFVKYKKFSKKSEIKLGLVFKKIVKDKEVKQQEKIDKLVDKLKVKEMFEDQEDAVATSTNFSIQREELITDCLDDYLEESDSDHEEVKQEEPIVESKKRGIRKTDDEGEEKYQLSKAYSITVEGTRNLELALQKDRNQCYHQWEKFLAAMYSLYLLLAKYQTKPPRSYEYLIFILYAGFITVDILLLFNFVVHLCYPISNLWTIGLPFFLVYPMVPLTAPIIALIGILNGKAITMQTYGEYNALQFLVNLPLTFLVQIVLDDQLYYKFIVCWLWANKIVLSLLNGMVRAHFQYPYFQKNEKILNSTFGIETKSEDDDYEDFTEPTTRQSQASRRSQSVEVEERLDLDTRNKSVLIEESKESESTRRKSNQSQVVGEQSSLNQNLLNSEFDN